MTESLRHKMFLTWCDEYATQEELAVALGVSQGYVGQLKNGVRPITEKTARKFELARGLEPGAMDAAPSHQPIPFGAAHRIEIVADANDLALIGSGSLDQDEVLVPRITITDSHVLYVMPDNSMTPVGSGDFGLIAGDYALVDTREKSPKNESLVLARVGDALIVRQLIGKSLVALNKYYSDTLNDLEVIGTVRQRHSNKTF